MHQYIGRYGYASSGNGGGINTDKLKDNYDNTLSILSHEFKHSLITMNWTEAFDILNHALDAGLITEKKRDKLVTECIPFMSDCC
jgi:hypothetical protein